MKKRKNILLVLVSLVAVLLIWNLTAPAQFQGEALSFSDSWRIRTLLMIKTTDFIEYGCGFSEDYAVKIGGLTYCLAEDDCNTIYIPELNFYYEIFAENDEQLHEIVKKYQ